MGRRSPPPPETKKIIEHSNGKPPPGDCPAPPATSRRVSRPSRCAPRPGPPLWTPFQARGCRDAPRHVLPRQESQTAPWPGQSAIARPADGPTVRPLPALHAPRAPAAALGGGPPVKNLAGITGGKGRRGEMGLLTNPRGRRTGPSWSSPRRSGCPNGIP